MGTETTHAGAHGQPDDNRRTTTDRHSRAAHNAANAAAADHDENEATATRPDTARSDTRHETKPHDPGRPYKLGKTVR
jgi:hypothetical protein